MDFSNLTEMLNVNLEYVHDVYANVNAWATDHPEVTVSLWIASIVLTIIHGFVIVRGFFNKPKNAPWKEVNLSPEKEYVPYIPCDTVLKTIRLLEKTDVKWSVFRNEHRVELSMDGFVKLVKSAYSNEVTIYYNKVAVTYHSFWKRADRELLAAAFDNRVRVEEARQRIEAMENHKKQTEEANNFYNNTIDYYLDSHIV